MRLKPISLLLFVLSSHIGVSGQIEAPSTDAVAIDSMVVSTPKTLVKRGGETYEMFDIQKEPSFPGGQAAMYKYLGKKIKYPKKARKSYIQGQVLLTFIVEKDGTISNVTIIKDIGGGCGEAVKRAIKSMPRWSPGEANDRPVKVRYTLPFKFRLE